MREVFRGDDTHQAPLAEDALGQLMPALFRQLMAACTAAADDLTEAVEEAFAQHPDADVTLSFPGSRRPARRPGARRDRGRPRAVRRLPAA